MIFNLQTKASYRNVLLLAFSMTYVDSFFIIISMNQQIQSKWTIFPQTIIRKTQKQPPFNQIQHNRSKYGQHKQIIEQRHKMVEEVTIQKYLNIKRKVTAYFKTQEDYLKRISQIVRIFQIDLKLIGNIEYVPQQLNFYLNKKKQLTSIQFCTRNQPYFFAQYLYAVKQIIVKVKKINGCPSNLVNLFIFDLKGKVLAIFIDCQDLKKTIKLFKEKFRNLQKIFWTQITKNKLIDLKQFLFFKQLVEGQFLGIYLDAVQNDLIDLNDLRQASSLLIGVNQYFSLNYGNVFVIGQQSNQLVSEFDLEKIYKISLKHAAFELKYFQSVGKSMREDKNLLTKNSVCIRLAALYFNRFIIFAHSTLDNCLLDQLHKNIIIELMKVKKQFMNQKIQNTKNIAIHQPVFLSSCGKLCTYCRKKKTTYKCFGCSANFEKSIPLCAQCFLGYHSKQNNGCYVPKSIQKQQMLGRQSLRLSEIQAKNCQSVFKLCRISDPQTLKSQMSFSQNNKQNQLNSYKKFIEDCNALMFKNKEPQLSIFKMLEKK